MLFRNQITILSYSSSWQIHRNKSSLSISVMGIFFILFQHLTKIKSLQRLSQHPSPERSEAFFFKKHYRLCPRKLNLDLMFWPISSSEIGLECMTDIWKKDTGIYKQRLVERWRFASKKLAESKTLYSLLQSPYRSHRNWLKKRHLQ